MLEKIKNNNWIIVIFLYLISEIVINPIGEFPLNDDWAYTKAIYTYLNSGEIRFLEWQAIPCFTQQVMGLAICKVVGFSFTALRILTISATIVLTVTLSQILRHFEIKSQLRFIILLAFVFNPLTFSLSNTFMPDIFVLMFTLIAFLFMEKMFNEFNSVHFILFSCFTIAATLVRQTGIVLPLTFAIVYCLAQPRTTKNIIIGLLPVLCNIVALFLYVSFFRKMGKLPGSFNYQFGNILQSITHPTILVLKTISYYFVTSTICLGVFLLPFTVGNLKQHWSQFKSHWGLRILTTIYLVIVLIKVISSPNVMPCVGNMLYQFGVGPVILTGFDSNDAIIPFYWQIFWKILNIIGGLSFCCVMISILRKVFVERITTKNYLVYLTPTLFILYLFPICLSYANDRYLLYVLPFLLLTYVLSFGFQHKKTGFLILFIPLTIYSVAGTHDYMDFHRARWKAGNHLTKELGVSPHYIDGGFEFNAWYLYGSDTYKPDHKGRWWWVENDTYIVSPSIIKGYKIESTYKLSTWMSFDFEQLYILKKTALR